MNPGDDIDGRYTVIRLLGEGGMGAVYEVEHNMVGRRFALKMLHPQYATDKEVITRFHQEARAAGSIGNDHIIEVTDMGVTPKGMPYIVMERLDGEELLEFIKRNGRLHVPVVASLMIQVCHALGAVHAKGIVHRDLKPENIFIAKKHGRSDFVKILDFGISKVRQATMMTSGLTKDGSVFGTPYYMSPEQLEDSKDVDGRTDIYAVGIIMYKALTGKLPFYSETIPALMMKILMEEPLAPRSIVPDLPEEIERIVMKAMAKEREQRYAGVADLMNDLLPFGDSHWRSRVSLAPMAAPAGAPHAAGIAATETLPGIDTSMSATHAGTQSHLQPKKGKLGLLIGGSIGAVLLLTAVVIVGVSFLKKSGNGEEVQSFPITALAEPAAGGEAPPGDAAQVTLDVKVGPEGIAAAVELDGEPVEGDPPVGTFEKSDEKKLLRVSAKGYTTYEEWITLEKDRSIQVVLQQVEEGTVAKDTGRKKPKGKSNTVAAETPEVEKGGASSRPKKKSSTIKKVDSKSKSEPADKPGVYVPKKKDAKRKNPYKPVQ